MIIQENVSLADLTTIQVGGQARYVLTVENCGDVRAAVSFARERNLPWFVLGGGSNVIAQGDFDGVIILNRIAGFRELDDAVFQIGAGEITDEVIAKLCAQKLSGMECLSLIPGRVGALPVQNVGAYGQEIAQTLTELTVFDARDNQFKILSRDDCEFAYRDSIFKSQENRHYIICDITLRLNRDWLQPPFYPALENYLLEKFPQNVAPNGEFRERFSPSQIRDAVIAIRNSKLPPVAEIPSAGSFFKNPIVDADFAQKFLAKFPDAPHWAMENEHQSDGKIAANKCEKLSAGWLIDRAGLKGFAKYGFQIYPENALVITHIAVAKNRENSASVRENSAENLAKFKNEIIEKVREKFGVMLEQEPESLC